MRELSSATQTLRDLLRRDLFDLIDGLPDDPVAARAVLRELLPGLVSAYGESAATLAAEWFEDVYAAPATLAVAPSLEMVDSGVLFAAKDLESSGLKLGAMQASVDRWVADQARGTIRSSAAKNRMRYARVPRGSKTCAFCTMLASRGAVYASERSAGRGDKYHGNCHCYPVASRSDDDLPEGYNPDELYDLYSAAREMAGTSNASDVVAAMRRLDPDRFTDGVHST